MLRCVVLQRDDQVVRLDIDAVTAAAFEGLTGVGVIDEDASHCLGGGLQVVAAGREPTLAAELQERLVNQGRGVERMPRLFPCQPGRRDFAEFVVNLRQQFCGVLFRACGTRPPSRSSWTGW